MTHQHTDDHHLRRIEARLGEILERIAAMSDRTQTAIDGLQTDVNALAAQVTANGAFIVDLSARLTAALAGLATTGLTDAQLAAVTAIDQMVKDQVDALTKADTATV